MNDQEFEDLAKRWPDLFQKSGNFEFSIGVGWLNIIDTLCRMISYRVDNAKQRLKYAIENPTAKFLKPLDHLEAEVAAALEELPIITQVKEKFGTLRFYTYGGTAEMDNYIEFAQAMTACICEECGSPGRSRSGGWVKVHCDKHYRENNAGDYPDAQVLQKPIHPKLAEE